MNDEYFITKKNSKQFVLDELENIKFPKNKSRVNVSAKPTEAFAMGSVNYRGQKSLGGRTKGPSRFNKKFPELYESITDLIRFYKPNFKYTTIQVNKNIRSKPHVDKNNVGPSYIIALGDFTGGKLVIEGKEFNIKNRWKKFNGTLGHWVEPFKGTRYSLVYFTHTFKPPCASLRNIEVKPDGLYKNKELMKSYQ
jgi:hypothetical protein